MTNDLLAIKRSNGLVPLIIVSVARKQKSVQYEFIDGTDESLEIESMAKGKVARKCNY